MILPLISLSSAAQSAAAKRISGAITTRDGNALSGATVEILDSSGKPIAKSVTDAEGRFEITTDALAGEYELIVTNSGQLNDEQIQLGRVDVSVKIVVSGLTHGNVDLARYRVSAGDLAISPKVRARIAAAQVSFERGDSLEAMSELEAAIKLCPSCSGAWSMRAFVRMAARDLPGAMEDASHSVELDASNATAYLALGSAHNAAEDFGAAEGDLRRSLELNPNSWQAQLELAKAWYAQRKFVLALKELELIGRDFPDVHLLRGNVLVSLGRKHEGAAEFIAFLREVPGDRRAAQIRGIVADISRAMPDSALEPISQ